MSEAENVTPPSATPEGVAPVPAASTGGKKRGILINQRYYVSDQRKKLKGIGKILTGYMQETPETRRVIWTKILKRLDQQQGNESGAAAAPYETSPLRETAASIRYLANFLSDEELLEMRARTIHVFRAVQNEKCIALFLEPLGHELTSSRLVRPFRSNEGLCRVVVHQMLRILLLLQKSDTCLTDVGGRNWAVQNVEDTVTSAVRVKVVSLKLEKAPEDPEEKEVFWISILRKIGVLVYLITTGHHFKNPAEQQKQLSKGNLSKEAKSFINSMLELAPYFLMSTNTATAPPTAGGGGGGGGGASSVGKSSPLPKQSPTIQDLLDHPWISEGSKLQPPTPFVDLAPVEKMPPAQMNLAIAAGKSYMLPGRKAPKVGSKSSVASDKSGQTVAALAADSKPPKSGASVASDESTATNPHHVSDGLPQPIAVPGIVEAPRGGTNGGDDPAGDSNSSDDDSIKDPVKPSKWKDEDDDGDDDDDNDDGGFDQLYPDNLHPLDVALALARELQLSPVVHGKVRMFYTDCWHLTSVNEKASEPTNQASQRGDVVDFALHVLFRVFHQQMYNNARKYVGVKECMPNFQPKLIALVQRLLVEGTPPPDGAPIESLGGENQVRLEEVDEGPARRLPSPGETVQTVAVSVGSVLGAQETDDVESLVNSYVVVEKPPVQREETGGDDQEDFDDTSSVASLRSSHGGTVLSWISESSDSSNFDPWMDERADSADDLINDLFKTGGEFEQIPDSKGNRGRVVSVTEGDSPTQERSVTAASESAAPVTSEKVEASPVNRNVVRRLVDILVRDTIATDSAIPDIGAMVFNLESIKDQVAKETE